MSDAGALSIELSQVLYRTRGRDWDYAFLLQPEPLLSEGWYTLHRRIFAGVEPTEAPVLLRGELGVGLGQPFFATAYVDAARRDSQDRAIAHYLTWFGRAAEYAPGLSYGPGLVAALEPALSSVFDLAPESLRRGDGKPLDSLLRARFLAALPARSLLVPARQSSALRWLGTISP